MVAKKARVELEKQLKNDDRDVADLWKEALKSYESIVGFGLQRKFDNVQSMLDYGTDQMNNFHKFRHDKGKDLVLFQSGSRRTRRQPDYRRRSAGFSTSRCHWNRFDLHASSLSVCFRRLRYCDCLL
ncbi:hypothetical protein LB505_009825 [Fusarium chuoi]|nr:hypothetical protein LB505_009825 [Fusarium chuoi]